MNIYNKYPISPHLISARLNFSGSPDVKILGLVPKNLLKDLASVHSKINLICGQPRKVSYFQ